MAGWGRSTWGAGPWGEPAKQSVSFTLTGVAGTSALGTVVASIPKSVTVSGLSSTSALGSITQVAKANITLSG